LGAKLALKDICQRAANAEYKPRRFSALIIKKRSPNCTILLFSTGRAVLTGLKGAAPAKLAARKLARMLGKLGYKVSVREFTIQNVVGTFSCQYTINMTVLQMILGASSTIYEPELFPGMSYKMRALKCTALIFSSGKVVLTGAKSEAHIWECYYELARILAAAKPQCMK
jgi:transcription initiation factor TFIID TATA-box-binding protein